MAFGLAVLSAIATARTHDLLAAHLYHAPDLDTAIARAGRIPATLTGAMIEIRPVVTRWRRLALVTGLALSPP